MRLSLYVAASISVLAASDYKTVVQAMKLDASPDLNGESVPHIDQILAQDSLEELYELTFAQTEGEKKTKADSKRMEKEIIKADAEMHVAQEHAAMNAMNNQQRYMQRMIAEQRMQEVQAMNMRRQELMKKQQDKENQRKSAKKELDKAVKDIHNSKEA